MPANTLSQSDTLNAGTQIAEVQQAAELANSYINMTGDKLEKVATIIGGEGVKAYGVTGENIIKVFAAVGAYNSWQYLSKKGRENWKYIGLAVVALIAYRQMTGSTEQTPPNNQI